MTQTQRKWRDLAERTLWTLLEGGIGVGLITTFGWPAMIAVPLMGALAAVKGYLATKYGKGTAALPEPEQV